MRIQGINIPHIRLVIQYGLTCDFDSLIQRFGRGARDFALWAICILLVGQEHFDDFRAELAARLAANGEPPSKRRKTQAETPNPTGASTSSLTKTQAPGGTTVTSPDLLPKKRGGAIEPGSDPLMDDFINARSRPGLKCRREVIDAYYGNDMSGKC